MSRFEQNPYVLDVELKWEYGWGFDTRWREDEIEQARERIRWLRDGWPIGGQDVHLVRISRTVIE